MIRQSVDDDAAVEDACILIKLPAKKIVAAAGVLWPDKVAIDEGSASGPQVVMKRVRETNGFIFHGMPASVKATHVIADIASKKAVLSALNLLLKFLAIVREGWLLICRGSASTQKRNAPDDCKPYKKPIVGGCDRSHTQVHA